MQPPRECKSGVPNDSILEFTPKNKNELMPYVWVCVGVCVCVWGGSLLTYSLPKIPYESRPVPLQAHVLSLQVRALARKEGRKEEGGGGRAINK